MTILRCHIMQHLYNMNKYISLTSTGCNDMKYIGVISRARTLQEGHINNSKTLKSWLVLTAVL